MAFSEHLFTSFLTDRKSYRWYDHGMNWFLVVLWIILYGFCSNTEQLWIELIPWVLLALYLIYCGYRNRSYRTGTIEIYSDGIRIRSNKENRDFPMDRIQQMKIERGSNLHSFDIGEEPRMSDNTIEFIFEGRRYRFLFMIESHVRNKEFEDMIQSMTHAGISFEYRSI